MYGMPYVFQPVSLPCDSEVLSCSAAIGGHRHLLSGHAAESLTTHVDDPSSLAFFLVERYPLYSHHKRLLKAHMYHPPWPLKRMEPIERSWAIPVHLGLKEALHRVDEVHCSLGVDVQMWAAKPC